MDHRRICQRTSGRGRSAGSDDGGVSSPVAGVDLAERGDNLGSAHLLRLVLQLAAESDEVVNYTRKSFTVNSPISKEYADRWEQTFRKPEPGAGQLHMRPDGTQCSYLAEVTCDKCGWCDPKPRLTGVEAVAAIFMAVAGKAAAELLEKQPVCLNCGAALNVEDGYCAVRCFLSST